MRVMRAALIGALAATTIAAVAVRLLQNEPEPEPRGPVSLGDALHTQAAELVDPCAVPPDRAVRLLRHAVSLLQGRAKAGALEDLALVAHYQGDSADAERYVTEALRLREQVDGKDSPALLDTLLALGYILFDQGKYREMEGVYKRALQIAGSPRPDSFHHLAEIYNDLGELHRVRNRYEAAEAAFEKARGYGLKVLPEDDILFSLVSNNLAGLYKDRGEYSRAESRLRQELSRLRASPGTCPGDLARAELNLGEIYRLQGDLDQARPYYQRALGLAREAFGKDSQHLAVYHNQHAVIDAEQGRYPMAVTHYEEALRLTRTALGDRHPKVAQSLHDLGHLHERNGRQEEAQRLYREALSIREEVLGHDHPEVAVTLTRLASSLALAGQIAPSLEAVERATAIFGRTRRLYPEDRVEALTLRARLRRRTDDQRAALADLRQSLEIVEEMRPWTGGEEARIRFQTRHADVFHLMIAWEVEAGEIEHAFEYAERSRARVLLDQLAEARVDFLAAIPEPGRRSNLAERRAAAGDRLAEARRRRAVLQDSGGSMGSLLEEEAQAEEEVRRIEEEIRTESPLARMSFQPEPLSLPAVQSRLVPPGGLILMYEIGPEHSFLFVIPESGREAEVLPLPPTRERLEQALLEVLRLLGEHPERSFGGVETRAGMLLPGLHDLWLALIPAEVRERVMASSQVLVIPDGALHRLPFEALVPRLGPTLAENSFWIDAGPPLRYAASATSLAALQRRADAEAGDARPGSTILSVSDPLFDRAPKAEGLAERGGLGLFRLRWTAEETRALLDLFAGEVLRLQGGEAEEARVRAELPGKRYIHLATHGLVDEGREPFAALAFTPPSGPAGEANDGFLQLHEIYRMRLNCRLAVLSACRTGFGSPREGEGVFTLARGFLVAGARRVVASLWQVSDFATASLMKSYFRRIADAADPPDYTRSLHEAKREIAKPGPWRDPYFWAPFILTGEE